MKKFMILVMSAFLPLVASADACDIAKLSRDAIRAIALVSDRSMITDLVGGCRGSSCDIWANYRSHGYSDRYEVVTELNHCRVLSLRLVSANQPIQN